MLALFLFCLFSPEDPVGIFPNAPSALPPSLCLGNVICCRCCLHVLPLLLSTAGPQPPAQHPRGARRGGGGGGLPGLGRRRLCHRRLHAARWRRVDHLLGQRQLPGGSKGRRRLIRPLTRPLGIKRETNPTTTFLWEIFVWDARFIIHATCHPARLAQKSHDDEAEPEPDPLPDPPPVPDPLSVNGSIDMLQHGWGQRNMKGWGVDE